MVWAVRTEVAVFWFVVVFSGGFGTRHAVGDDEPAVVLSAAAPPDSSSCQQCEGVPYTVDMLGVALQDMLGDGVLCLSSCSTFTVVDNSTQLDAGFMIFEASHLPASAAAATGGHVKCPSAGNLTLCTALTSAVTDEVAALVDGGSPDANLLGLSCLWCYPKGHSCSVGFVPCAGKMSCKATGGAYGKCE